MGSTKMLMEKLMFSRARFKNRRTIICTVRYGNVMFSRGSVLPLFFQQIKEGKIRESLPLGPSTETFGPSIFTVTFSGIEIYCLPIRDIIIVILPNIT